MKYFAYAIVMAMIVPVSAGLGLVGCGESSTVVVDDHIQDHQEEEDHEEEDEADALAEAEGEACEHLEEGPFEEVFAVTEGTLDDFPVISNDHKAYEIRFASLTTDPDSWGGQVAFNAPESGEYAFFLRDEAEMKINDNGEIDTELLNGAEGCDLVAMQYHAEVELGTVAIELASDAISSTTVVIWHLGEEADHDHAHE